MVFDAAKEIAKAAVPPSDGNPAHLLRWGWTITLVTIGIGAMNAFHIAWACGLLSGYGLFGFARAEDLQTQAKQLNTIQMIQLDNQIITTRTRQCEAIAKNNAAAKFFAEYRLQQLTQQWADLAKNHTPYRIPDCSEL